LFSSLYELKMEFKVSEAEFEKINLPKNQSPNNKALFALFGLIFVFFVMLLAFAAYTMKSFTELAGEEKELTHQGRIAVIEIEGVIMDSKKTIELLLFAEESKDFDAIILRINSPGGAVGPTQEIYEEMQRIDKIKPIYASFGAIAASGGYYLGAGARKIWASPGTLTGSIGVIMDFMDLSKLYEFAKVSPQTVKAGKYKDAGNPSRGLTDEEKELMDKLIAGVHEQFKNDILKRRKNLLKADISEVAQGQIFSGEEAFNLGLVDEMGSLWTAGRSIHKSLKLKGDFGLKFIKKKKTMGFIEMLGNLEESISHLNLKSLLHADKSPVLMFR